ncbi:MAG: hypothetical protein ABT940_05340 [Alphaproteobacteria bacterium]
MGPLVTALFFLGAVVGLGFGFASGGSRKGEKRKKAGVSAGARRKSAGAVDAETQAVLDDARELRNLIPVSQASPSIEEEIFEGGAARKKPIPHVVPKSEEMAVFWTAQGGFRRNAYVTKASPSSIEFPARGFDADRIDLISVPALSVTLAVKSSEIRVDGVAVVVRLVEFEDNTRDWLIWLGTLTKIGYDDADAWGGGGRFLNTPDT